MPKIKLVTNVSEYGLFRSVAESRGRLIAITLAALTATYAAGLWAADYIFEQSASVVLNLLIITAMMMILLVASYLLTVLVGDLFFPGPWREQIILGRTPSDGRVTVEDHSAEFMIVLLLMVVLNAFSLNVIADGFLDRYHNEGFFQVRLRADNPDERLDALEDIADPMNYKLWELEGIREMVVDVFDDEDPDVRQRAYWTAGHLEVEQAQPKLIDVLQQQVGPAEKAAAAVALGKLGDVDDARKPLEAFLAESDSAEARVGALRGLGLLEAGESVEAILPLTGADDEQVMVHAYWALRMIGSKEARPRVRQIIDDEPTGIERCAAYDAMKRLATEEDVLWARRTFQRTEIGDDECEHLIWTDHDAEQYYIVYGDSFREKLMKIVANTNAFEHREWFQRLVNDPEEPWRIREVADEVLRQIKEADRTR